MISVQSLQALFLSRSQKNVQTEAWAETILRVSPILPPFQWLPHWDSDPAIHCLAS